MTAVTLDLQTAAQPADLPDESGFLEWATAAIEVAGSRRRELVIRVVEAGEMRDLNRDYRGRDAVTNVLSFPFEPLPGIETGHLGDLAICGDVVVAEAAAQGKNATAHWAHMVVHGVLHLCGHDHQTDTEAGEMEALEIRVLAALGFSDPYREDRCRDGETPAADPEQPG